MSRSCSFYLSQRKLTSSKELETFSKMYYRFVKVKFDLEFLKQRNVYGLYNKKKQLIAGYIINSRAPFRILDLIPKEKRQQLPFEHDFNNDFFELIGMWMLPRSLFFRFVFYMNVFSMITSYKKKYMIGAAINQPMFDMYSPYIPNLLYQGELNHEFKKNGGAGNQNHIWVSYGETKNLEPKLYVDAAKYIAKCLLLKLKKASNGTLFKNPKPYVEKFQYVLRPLVVVVLALSKIVVRP